MNLKEMYIKNFQKRKAVIILMADESQHITKHWAIPDKGEKTVQLIGIEKTIVIHKDKMHLSTKWNIPTYIVNYKNCEPVDLSDVNKNIYGAHELDLIVKNDMAHKVFKASSKSSLSDEGKIILIIMLVLIAALGYFMNTKFQDLETALTPDPDPIVVVEPDPDPETDGGDPLGN